MRKLCEGQKGEVKTAVAMYRIREAAHREELKRVEE